MIEHDFADSAAEPGSNSDANDAGLPFLGVAGGFGGVGRLDDELAGLLEENVACLRQLNAVGIANEKRDAEILFELANLAAQGRLSDVELLGGLAKVEDFGDRDEVANVTEFHAGDSIPMREMQRNCQAKEKRLSIGDNCYVRGV